MASRKIKSIGHSKQRTSTPYQKPKGVVQTVKDWLTPSKWVSPWKDDDEEIIVHVDHTSGGSFTEIPKGKETVIEKREEDNFTMEEESVPFVSEGIEVYIEDEEEPDKNITPINLSPKGSLRPSTNASFLITRNGLVPASSSVQKLSQRINLTKSQTSSPPNALNNTNLFSSTPYVISTDEANRHTDAPLPKNIRQHVDTPRPFLPSKRNKYDPGIQSFHPSARSGPSFSVSTFQSPTHSLTNISLSRSPFSSPFYSGRTVYGGSSSMNTSSLFRKRVRTETSPPDLTSHKLSVRPHPSSHPSDGAASQTARKILDTLHSLSSPLHDARKLPLRVASPAKKMRMDPPPSHSTITSPPPPVSSLTTTSHASLSSIKQPLVVPCEKRPPKGTQTINVNLAPLKTQFSGNNTGLIQKPHPLIHSPTSPTSRSGGKIRMTRHTCHYSSKNKEEGNDEVVNPMTLPPPISLHVPSSVTLAPFSISGLNPTAKTSLSTTPTSFQFMASQTPITPHTHPASKAVPTSSIFSFTSPIAVVDKPLPQTTPTSSMTKQFQFSRPVVVSGSVQKPNLSDIKSTPVSSVQHLSSSNPTSKSSSILEMLKRPEYQIDNIRKEAYDNKPIDLTETSDSLKVRVSNESSSTTSSTSGDTCNWSCDECWVSNASTVTKCVACGVVRPESSSKRKPPDLTSSSKRKSPDLTSSSKGKPPDLTGGITIGKTGGIKLTLPTSSSLLSSSSSSAPIISGFKLPSGGLTLSSDGFKLAKHDGLGSTSGIGVSLSTGTSHSMSTSLKDGTVTTGSISMGSTGIGTGLVSTNSSKTVAGVITTTLGGGTSQDSSSWDCGECWVKNNCDRKTCVACGGNRPDSKEDTSTTVKNTELKLLQTSKKTSSDNSSTLPLPSFVPPSNWECPVCMISNKTDSTKCAACGEIKPGCSVKKDDKTVPTPLKFGESGGLKIGANLFSKPVVASSTGSWSFDSSSGNKMSTSLSLGQSGGLKIGPVLNFGDVKSLERIESKEENDGTKLPALPTLSSLVSKPSDTQFSGSFSSRTQTGSSKLPTLIPMGTTTTAQSSVSLTMPTVPFNIPKPDINNKTFAGLSFTMPVTSSSQSSSIMSVQVPVSKPIINFSAQTNTTKSSSINFPSLSEGTKLTDLTGSSIMSSGAVPSPFPQAGSASGVVFGAKSLNSQPTQNIFSGNKLSFGQQLAGLTTTNQVNRTTSSSLMNPTETGFFTTPSSSVFTSSSSSMFQLQAGVSKTSTHPSSIHTLGGISNVPKLEFASTQPQIAGSGGIFNKIGAPEGNKALTQTGIFQSTPGGSKEAGGNLMSNPGFNFPQFSMTPKLDFTKPQQGPVFGQMGTSTSSSSVFQFTGGQQTTSAPPPPPSIFPFSAGNISGSSQGSSIPTIGGNRGPPKNVRDIRKAKRRMK